MSEPTERSPEEIAHVPRKILQEQDWLPHGYRDDPDRQIYSVLRERVRYAPRPGLEEDETNKQLIPYVVVRCGDRFLTLRRRSAQSEERLHDQLSIGVGGHISRADDDAEADPIASGMRRELHEELHIPRDIDVEYCGLLNDDSNAVGRVHCGLVYRCEAEAEEVEVRETEKMVGEWRSLPELQEYRDQLETWSQFLLPAIREGQI